VILSSVSMEESDTLVGLLVLSAATLAHMGGCKWKLSEVGVRRLSSLEQPMTTTLSFQTPCHAPSWVRLVEVMRRCNRV
jgi:hypothetical protein